MSARIKISRELEDILEEANNEVAGWSQWQRSLDPQGPLASNESEDIETDLNDSAA